MKFDGDPNDCKNFNGFMHPTKITYSKNFDDYNELLKYITIMKFVILQYGLIYYQMILNGKKRKG